MLIIVYLFLRWERRLTEKDISPEPKVRFDCSLSEKKAYIHGNLFDTIARSVRCIPQSAIYYKIGQPSNSKRIRTSTRTTDKSESDVV